MASSKDLKKRIGTVENTKQTTNAMKMVSAAKLRRAQESIVAQRPYAKKIGKLIQKVSSMGSVTQMPSLVLSEAHKENSEKNILLILVTSDRGLCGAFNSNITKRGLRWSKEEGAEYNSVRFGFLGKKGYALLKKLGDVVWNEDFGRKATFSRAKSITQFAIKEYESGNFDEIHFVYNEFKNAITQLLVVEKFLPVLSDEVDFDTDTKESFKDEVRDSEVDRFIVKPGANVLLKRLLEKHFAVQAHRIMLESQASEHGARMSAMDNATRNAGEMLKSLSLQYNKQRQAGITKELLEIISGAESQKG